MSEKTINGMHKSELIALIKGTIAKVNRIDQALEKSDSIDKSYEKINNLYDAIFSQDGQQSKIDDFLATAEAHSSDIDSAHSKICGEHEGLSGEIKNAHSQSLAKLQAIQKAYDEIQGNETDSGIKAELDTLVTDFQSQNEKISEAHDEIFNTEDSNEGSGFLEKIKNAQIEAEEKLTRIENFHKEVFEGTDETKSIQNELNDFASEFRNRSNEFTGLHNDIFGYTEVDENGEEIKHIGRLNRTKEIFKKYEDKYDKLFNQIEGLLSGATTTSLSKNFDDKVEEYKKEREKWEARIFWFLICLLIVSIIFALAIVFINSIETSTIYIIGMPIYTFGIWLMIFMGNRRAESRKLEESFKHKFVMAKSFVGYKKSITEMTDKDDILMNIHMNNLLNAISKDSSKFFEIKGESHPVVDFLKKTKNSESKTDNAPI